MGVGLKASSYLDRLRVSRGCLSLNTTCMRSLTGFVFKDKCVNGGLGYTTVLPDSERLAPFLVLSWAFIFYS